MHTTAVALADSPPEVHPLSEGAFHQLGDAALEAVQDLLQSLEDAVADSATAADCSVDDVDLSLSQGVLTISLQLKSGGSKVWVINKQTPNRQLWWSSPLSGPRRYEYVPRSDAASADAEEWQQLLMDWRFIKNTGSDNDQNNTLLQHLQDEMMVVTGIDICATAK